MQASRRRLDDEVGATVVTPCLAEDDSSLPGRGARRRGDSLSAGSDDDYAGGAATRNQHDGALEQVKLVLS